MPKCKDCKRLVWYETRDGRKVAGCPMKDYVEFEDEVCDKFVPRK